MNKLGLDARIESFRKKNRFYTNLKCRILRPIDPQVKISRNRLFKKWFNPFMGLNTTAYSNRYNIRRICNLVKRLLSRKSSYSTPPNTLQKPLNTHANTPVTYPQPPNTLQNDPSTPSSNNSTKHSLSHVKWYLGATDVILFPVFLIFFDLNLGSKDLALFDPKH